MREPDFEDEFNNFRIPLQIIVLWQYLIANSHLAAICNFVSIAGFRLRNRLKEVLSCEFTDPPKPGRQGSLLATANHALGPPSLKVKSFKSGQVSNLDSSMDSTFHLSLKAV